MRSACAIHTDFTLQFSSDVVYIATDQPIYMETIGKSTNTERRPDIAAVI